MYIESKWDGGEGEVGKERKSEGKGKWREWGDGVEKHKIGGKIRNYKYVNHAMEYFIPCFPLVWVIKIK